MKVYVVTHGERGEGAIVIAVMRYRSDAVSRALSVKTCFDGGWRVSASSSKASNDFYASNGCDFVAVEEFEIEKPTKGAIR